MTSFILNPPEGRIIASEGIIQLLPTKGRCRELVLDQHFVRLLANSDGLIATFLEQVERGLAYEIMFGERPSQEVLDGKRLLTRPMLTIRKAKRGELYWFGFVTRPTHVSSRHRLRALVSLELIDTLLTLAMGHEEDEGTYYTGEEIFWVIRGKLGGESLEYTFNSVTALVEFEPGRGLGIKRIDADIWDGLAEMARFVSESGPDSEAEGFVPDCGRPEYSADLRAVGENEITITLNWNGFPQFMETLDVDVLTQVSTLMNDMWPTMLDASGIEAMLLGDDDEGEGSAS